MSNLIKEKKKGLTGLLDRIGFTNALAIVLILVIIAGLAGGFYLALESIRTGYMGSLLCWTVVFTPIGTAIGIVLGKIVDKSRDENTGPNGEGVKYMQAMKSGFNKNSEQAQYDESELESIIDPVDSTADVESIYIHGEDPEEVSPPI